MSNRFKTHPAGLWHDTKEGPCECGAWHYLKDWAPKEKRTILPEPTYFESHVTIEPCQGERLEQLKSIVYPYRFRVADLLMQRSLLPSDLDSFCTGRSIDYEELLQRMKTMVAELNSVGFKVRRQKIESVLFDVRSDT